MNIEYPISVNNITIHKNMNNCFWKPVGLITKQDP